jgi:hypothetical protein
MYVDDCDSDSLSAMKCLTLRGWLITIARLPAFPTLLSVCLLVLLAFFFLFIFQHLARVFPSNVWIALEREHRAEGQLTNASRMLTYPD